MLENGEIISLEDGKEYICVSSIENEGNIYIYLMSNFKPLDIKFAKQLTMQEETLKIEVINNQEEKEKVMNLFQKEFNA